MKILLFISLGLFVVACCLPALDFKQSTGKNDIMLGLRALAVGWSGIFAAIVAWYANPVWAFAIVIGFCRKPVICAVAGIVALLIALTTFSIVGRELPADEGNVNRMTVVRLLPGFYVWLASMAVLPLAILLPKLK
jgi:hypothetical protein